MDLKEDVRQALLTLQQEAGEAASVAERIGMAQQTCVDVPSRTIWYCSEIDHEPARAFITAFSLLDQTPGPIRIVLSSCGGCVDAGLSMYDTVRASKNQVTIDGYGSVSSAAAVLLQAGAHRRLAENSHFMIHDGRTMVEEGHRNSSYFRKVAADLDFSDELGYKLLAERSKMTLKQISEVCKNDFYLTARQAVKLGFADEIIKAEHR